MEKIRFTLPINNLAGAATETLWAEEQENGVYCIQNVPFFAMGLSFGDTVQAKNEEGMLKFVKVVKHSGHSTYQVYLRVPRSGPDVVQMLDNVSKLGCNIEVASEKLLSIDVKPEADIVAVYSELERAEASEIIDFQEGHCGHLKSRPS